MSRAIMRQTQVSVALALTVQVRTAAGAQLVTLPLLPLTGLAMVIYTALRMVGRAQHELVTFYGDLCEALDFTAKVMAIVAVSLLFGLGVRQ